MRLWVDDVKNPEYTADEFGLPADPGEWVWAKTAQDARWYLFNAGYREERVVELALDNDLGWASDEDGRELATAILNRTLDDPDYLPPDKMTCISFNPVAERAIRLTFDDILRVVADRA